MRTHSALECDCEVWPSNSMQSVTPKTYLENVTPDFHIREVQQNFLGAL